MPLRSAPASSQMSAAVNPATSRAGRVTLRNRQFGGQPGDLTGLHRTARPPERGGIDQILRRRRIETGGRRTNAGVVGECVTDVDGVDHDRAELHADLVLERERRLDHLVDRGGLGQRDQHHLAPLGVVEQLEHVVGLCPHRPAS